MARNSHHKISVEERERASREVVQSYIATTAMYDFNVYEKRVLYNLVKLAQSQLEGVRLSENLFRIDHSLKGFVLMNSLYPTSLRTVRTRTMCASRKP